MHAIASAGEKPRGGGRRTLAYIINSSSSSSGRWRICVLPQGTTALPPTPGEEDAIVFSFSSSSTYSPPPLSRAIRESPPPTELLASEGKCRLTRRELALDLRRPMAPAPPPARGVDGGGGCSGKAESSRSGSRSSSSLSSSFTGTSMNAWTRRTTRGRGWALVGECGSLLLLLLSTRAVDEDAEACRFVTEEVADESLGTLGTGTRFFGVLLLFWASVLCRCWGKRWDEEVRGARTCDDDAHSCWLSRRVCSASTRRNWSFQALISPRSVSSRRKHWSFHCCASWRSWLTSSAWWVFCVKRREGGYQMDSPSRLGE